MCQSNHGIVHHADLWSVSVGDDDFAAFLYEIHDCFGGNLNSCHLFRQGVPERIAAKRDYNSFLFCHRLSLRFLFEYSWLAVFFQFF